MFFCCGIPKSHISCCVTQRELTVTKNALPPVEVFFGEIHDGQHSRNRPRPTKAEGASVFSYPFFVGFHSRRGVSKNRFSKSRPSVQEPIALVSVDFSSPKVMGTEKRHIPFWRLYLPSNRSICFREKETTQKNRYFLPKRYFFVKFTTGIFPAVSPQWGLPSISFCVTPTKDNSALYASRKDCAHPPMHSFSICLPEIQEKTPCDRG